MSHGNRLIGYSLIVIGLLFLIIKLGGQYFPLFSFWPLVFLVPGILFHLFGFGYRLHGLLIPGGIMLTYGLFFLFNEMTGYAWIGNLWPIFIIGPGIGLFEYYVFGERYFGILLPALILFGVGGTFLFFTLLSTAVPYVIGLVLILIGAYIIFGNKNKERR